MVEGKSIVKTTGSFLDGADAALESRTKLVSLSDDERRTSENKNE